MTGSGVSLFISVEWAATKDRKDGAARKQTKPNKSKCEKKKKDGEKVRKRTGHATNVPRPFNNGNLETKTDTQERAFLFSGPLDSENHAFCPTFAKTAGNQDTAALYPSIVVSTTISPP